MHAFQTPGVYRQPVQPVRPTGPLSRGDIALFLGYARRGPVGMPVRVESLTAFGEIFGPALEFGHLHSALKGFFETGGRTAYILRLTEVTARTARIDLPGGTWSAEASFSWAGVDPRRRRAEARPEEANWVQLIEDIFRTSGPRSPAPGAWANGYSVRIVGAERVRTTTIPGTPDDPNTLVLASLAGLEAHTVLRLAQSRRAMRGDGTEEVVTFSATTVATGIDAARQQVRLLDAIPEVAGEVDGQDDLPPAEQFGPSAFDLGAPIQVTSVEFDIEIYENGRLEQSFTALAPHPLHSFSLDNVMRSNARSLSLVANAGADADWADPSLWPDEGTFGLSGGTDGLEGISVTDYLRLLEQIARVEEAALISAPDLVLQDPAQPEADDLPPEPVDCCDLSPAAPGRVRARVVEVDVDGLEQPLNRVEVDVAGPGGRTVTNSDGVFTASNVALGLVTVRLAKAGFEPSEVLVQATTFLPSEPVTLTMTRVNLPRALVEDEIIEVVQALANPARVGSYKVVIVDPPSPDAVLDDLRTWRARLGDSQRMGFFAPWLTLPDDEADGGLIPCPPSGHVCGAFAAGEIAEGIHRTGANLPLRFVQGTTLEINDVEQSILNPAGINAIRTLPGRGVRAFGTRTLSSDTDWRYLTARRIVDAVEKTLERTLQWMVFEPNSLMTRHAVQQSAASLLSRLQRRGILSGDTPEQAFRVKCDLENNPDESRAAGQLVCDIGIAPTTPFEFVLFRLGSAFEALKVTETSR